MNILSFLFGFADPSGDPKIEYQGDDGTNFVVIQHHDDTYTAGITDKDDVIDMPVFSGTSNDVWSAFVDWWNK